MKLTIGHLYPDLLNLYGDRGNIQCMKKRCEWRGIEAEVREFQITDAVDFTKLDLVLLGGGSDREQMLVCEKLKTIREVLEAFGAIFIRAFECTALLILNGSIQFGIGGLEKY